MVKGHKEFGQELTTLPACSKGTTYMALAAVRDAVNDDLAFGMFCKE